MPLRDKIFFWIAYIFVVVLLALSYFGYIDLVPDIYYKECTKLDKIVYTIFIIVVMLFILAGYCWFCNEYKSSNEKINENCP